MRTESKKGDEGTKYQLGRGGKSTEINESSGSMRCGDEERKQGME